MINIPQATLVHQGNYVKFVYAASLIDLENQLNDIFSNDQTWKLHEGLVINRQPNESTATYIQMLVHMDMMGSVTSQAKELVKDAFNKLPAEVKEFLL